MAKNLKNSKRQNIKNQITKKLDEDYEKFKEKYNRQLAENIPSTVDASDTSTQQIENSIPSIDATENNIIKSPKEDKTMAKNFNFTDDANDFGTGAENKTITPETLPEIKDDVTEAEVKAKTNDGSKDEATTGRYADNLSELAATHIANFTNIQAEASAVATLLKGNLFIKQFITNGEFGRGFVLTKVKDEKNSTVSHFKIENLKPGRAKAVVITVPRRLQEVLAASGKKSAGSLRKMLLDATNNGQLTPEEKADTVDMVMGYDDLMVRVANLMEGQIAEFGGKGGDLDARITSRYMKKVDETTKEERFEPKDISANQATEVINGKSHIIYTMNQPNSALIAKAVSGEALGEKDKKTIKRYQEGKSPLKRTKNAFSALYTDKNFTSISKYETAKPFSEGFTKEQAVRLSARAAFGKSKLSQTDVMESYDTGMFAGDDGIAAVFNPNVPISERLETLQKAKGYQPKNSDGSVKVRKVRKVDATGKSVLDANDKPIYEEVPYEVRDLMLTDRVIKSYYTGQPLTDEEARNAEFVMYGEQGVNKKGMATSPRVRKTRLSFVGLEVEVSEGKGIVGTYGLDDESVSAFVNMVGEEVAKEAFIKAASRNSRGGDNTASSEYEDGQLAAILGAVSV